MLESGVLSLGVFTDNDHIDIVMTGLDSGYILNGNNVGVDTKVLGHLHVGAEEVGGGGSAVGSLEHKLVASKRFSQLGGKAINNLGVLLGISELETLPVNLVERYNDSGNDHMLCQRQRGELQKTNGKKVEEWGAVQ